MRKVDSVRMPVNIDSRLKQQLVTMAKGRYGALNALGIEILTEAVIDYKSSSYSLLDYERRLHSLPLQKPLSREHYELRVPPALRVSLSDIAAAEERQLTIVVERMLREGVARRLALSAT